MGSGEGRGEGLRMGTCVGMSMGNYKVGRGVGNGVGCEEGQDMGQSNDQALKLPGSAAAKVSSLRALVQFPRLPVSSGRSSWLWLAGSVPSCLASSSGLPRTEHGPTHIPVVRQC